jgi:hypothetical protein
VAALASVTLDPVGQRACQAQLNRIVLALDLGNLRRAQIEIGPLKQNTKRLGDGRIRRQLQALSLGYCARLRHLQGDYRRAGQLYGRATDTLHELREKRSLSLLLKYRSDLDQDLGHERRACRMLDDSIRLAQLGDRRVHAKTDPAANFPRLPATRRAVQTQSEFVGSCGAHLSRLVGKEGSVEDSSGWNSHHPTTVAGDPRHPDSASARRGTCRVVRGPS